MKKILFAIVAVSAVASFSQEVRPAGHPRTTIAIDTSRPGREVSDYLFTVNHRFPRGGFGMLNERTMKAFPDFVEKTRKAAGCVRWPGGTVANLVNWKETIGPLRERKIQYLGNLQHGPDFPYYGIDEHMAYCEEIGAKCLIMVPFAGCKSAQDAADLVEYLNAPNDGSNPGGGTDWAKERAKNGHPKPYGVTYFEIGNEMHDRNQRYWMNRPSFTGPDKDFQAKYANGDTVRGKDGQPEKHDGFADFARAMKKIDPSIIVCSSLKDIWDYLEDKSVCDGVIIHEYKASLGKVSTKRELYDKWVSRGDSMSIAFPKDIAKALANAPRKDTHALITEFGIMPCPPVWTDGKSGLTRDESRILGRGLQLATILANLVPDPSVEMLTFQGFTAYVFGGGPGIGSAGPVFNAMYAPDPMDPKKTICSSMALAYEMFWPLRGGKVLPVALTDNPGVSSEYVDSYKALVAVAARTKDGRTALLVVNRDPERSMTAKLAVPGMELPATVSASVMNGPDICSFNSPAHPEEINISTVELPVKNGCVEFPAHSIVTLVL